MKKHKSKLGDDGLSNVEREAMEAIDEVFSDTSVSQDETVMRLKNLISDIQMKISTLE